LADTAGMAKQQSKPQSPPLASWDVYKVASKAVLLGTVEAADADAAREAAAKEFKVDARRLFAVRRR
jgi:hypothetical protein